MRLIAASVTGSGMPVSRFHKLGGSSGARRCVGDRLGQADVEVEAERRGDLFGEVAAEAAMRGIDPAHEFALVEAEADRVVGLPLAGLPGRALPRHDSREAIEVGDDVAVDRLVEGEQAGLVGEQLADGDALLAGLSELGPVRADALVVVEPAAGVGERHHHRRQALGRRVDDHHGVRRATARRSLRSRTPPQRSTTFSPSL